MVQVIQIRMEVTGVTKVRNMLTGYTRTIPEGLDIGTRLLAKKSVAIIKRKAKDAGLKHWGGGGRQLLASATTDKTPGFTRYKRVRRGLYIISIPIHGKILDIGNYWITLKRGRLVTKWARFRGLIPDKVSVGGSIFVKQHRFIAPAVTEIVALALNRTRNPQRREVNKKIVRKGR